MSLDDNFESLFQMEEQVTDQKIITDFFKKKDINFKTEIPDKMMMGLIGLEIYSKNINPKLPKTRKDARQAVQLLKELMVSRNRQGRIEGKEMVGATRQQINKGSALASFLGIGEKK